jgi:hypothetical protein
MLGLRLTLSAKITVAGRVQAYLIKICTVANRVAVLADTLEVLEFARVVVISVDEAFLSDLKSVSDVIAWLREALLAPHVGFS